MSNQNQEKKLTLSNIIQQFIRRLVASVHILQLTTWDLKVIQKATTAKAKWVDQFRWTIKITKYCKLLFEKKKKMKKKNWKKRRNKFEKEKKREKKSNWKNK